MFKRTGTILLSEVEQVVLFNLLSHLLHKVIVTHSVVKGEQQEFMIHLALSIRFVSLLIYDTQQWLECTRNLVCITRQMLR